MGREEREQVRVNRVKERREKKGGERQGERVGVGEAGVVREGGETMRGQKGLLTENRLLRESLQASLHKEHTRSPQC